MANLKERDMNTQFPEIQSILLDLDIILASTDNRDEVLLGVCELLDQRVAHYHWTGFYLVDDSEDHLVLGPYVGAPTDHVKIAFGNGICGQVAVSNASRIIQDVSLEDNYLSCSVNVNSEIVFPIQKDGKFVAELDIDSHEKAPFTHQDTVLLESICKKLSELF